MNFEEILIRFLLLFANADVLNAFLRNPQNTALVLGSLIAISAGMLGCFLLLREMSLSADAISHTVLLGIVIAFLLMLAVGADPSLDSPLLIAGAAASGVVTVFLSEVLQRTGLLKQDSAIGLVFTLFFAIAIILISRYTDNVHLDEDSVMLGEIGVAWADTRSYPLGNYESIRISETDPRAEFRRICTNCATISPRSNEAVFALECSNCGTYDPVQAYSAGLTSERPRIVFWPRSLTAMLLLCLATLLFIAVFFKELKISVFDGGLAQSLGFRPRLLLYALMALVSLVAVAAFNAVGSILVVAFFIIPPATAYLLSDRVGGMLGIAGFCGVLSVVLGYWFAEARMSIFGRQFAWDTSISASIVITMLFIFFLVLCFSPRYGIIAVILRRRNQRKNFKELIVLAHIHHHSGTREEHIELDWETMHEHINWEKPVLVRILKTLIAGKFIRKNEREIVRLTPKGLNRVKNLHGISQNLKVQ